MKTNPVNLVNSTSRRNRIIELSRLGLTTIKRTPRSRFHVKFIEFEYFSNTRKQHQRGNTECGMYSIFFIVTMLTGKTPFYKNKVLSMDERIELFLKKKIPDEVVFDYRDLYFNKTEG